MKHLNTYSNFLAEHSENIQAVHHVLCGSGIKLKNPMKIMEIVPSPDFVIESKKPIVDINYNKKNKTSNDFWKYKL